MAAPKALICVVLLLGVIGFAFPRVSAGRVAPAVRCASTGESSMVSAAGAGGCGGSARSSCRRREDIYPYMPQKRRARTCRCDIYPLVRVPSSRLHPSAPPPAVAGKPAEISTRKHPLR
ncbi:hypothetical protein ZWY2020_027015 [Hordeum vulgare]|nr:hypothetical protein ZWY2020_027015 [Hordeum vulgare]